MFKKLVIAIFLVAATVGIAHAGYKSGYGVLISPGGYFPYAQGSLGNVRNSGNSVEFITCYVWNYTDLTIGSCSARDASGTTVSCNIPSGLFSAALSIGTDSFVKFFYATNGDCTEIDTAAGSHFAPKQL